MTPKNHVATPTHVRRSLQMDMRLQGARHRSWRDDPSSMDVEIAVAAVDTLGTRADSAFSIAGSGAHQPVRRELVSSLQPTRVSSRLPTAFVIAVAVAGALERWWAAAHPIGTLTSDGAVIGLMAMQLLHHGQLPAYMWGQSYGGSLEALLTAAVFGVAGVGTGQLLATTALASALCSIALWRAARQVVGELAAQIGALVFWVWPATALWRALKPGGTYMIGLALSLLAIGEFAKGRKSDATWRRLFLAGFWCGLALWSSPMSLELLLPASIFFAPTMWRARTRLVAFVSGLVVGAIPVIAFGASHHWSNLHFPGKKVSIFHGFDHRFVQFFTIEGPIAFGVRVEGTLRWVGGHVGEALGVIGAAALLAVALFVLMGRIARCRLPMLAIGLLPALYALNPIADHPGQGRYVLFVISMAALLIGIGIESAGMFAIRLFGHVLSRRRFELGSMVGVALFGLLGAIGLGAEPGAELVSFPTPDVAMPMNDQALLRLLAMHRIRDAYASYWMAYRVMFETGARTSVVPFKALRSATLAHQVATSPDPAYLFVSSSKTTHSFEAWCQDNGQHFVEWHLGAFTVVQPSRKITPEEVPNRVLQ